ncbi:Fanconi anemia group C protein [Pelodytes ibericus]
MDQVSPDAVLSLEHWLNKAVEWSQTTTLESQQDVCLHLPKLQEFLLQIYESLKHMSPRSAVEKYPTIGQFLGHLGRHPFVIGHEGTRNAWMSCLCSLYSSEATGPVELKANNWIQEFVCQIYSSSRLGIEEECKAIDKLGCSAVDFHEKLLKNTITLLVSRIKPSQTDDTSNNNRLSADDIRSISVRCIPIHVMPALSPLVEALLMHHSTEPTEVLDCVFLDSVNTSIIQKKIDLSESAVLSLWLRHLPSLEKAILDLFQRLIAIQSKSLREMEQIIKDSLLPQAACHPDIFMVIDGIFRSALLESDGNMKVMTIIRLFTRCFTQLYEKSNMQPRFPLRAYFPHSSLALLMALLRQSQGLTPDVCLQHLHGIVKKLKDMHNDKRSQENLFKSWFLLIHFGDWVDIAAEQLLTSESEISDDLLWLLAFYYNPCNDDQERMKTMVEVKEVYGCLAMLRSNALVCARTLQDIYERRKECQMCTMQLIRHLCVMFLLVSPKWHGIAKECISHMTQTQEAANEISDVLAGTVCRLNNIGMKNEKIIKIAHELLHDF